MRGGPWRCAAFPYLGKSPWQPAPLSKACWCLSYWLAAPAVGPRISAWAPRPWRRWFGRGGLAFPPSLSPAVLAPAGLPCCPPCLFSPTRLGIWSTRSHPKPGPMVLPIISASPPSTSASAPFPAASRSSTWSHRAWKCCSPWRLLSDAIRPQNWWSSLCLPPRLR